MKLLKVSQSHKVTGSLHDKELRAEHSLQKFPDEIGHCNYGRCPVLLQGQLRERRFYDT